MSGWTPEQDRDLLMTIISENIPKKGDWISISTKFGNGKSPEACRQHFAKLLKDFPGKMPSVNGGTRGTKRKADDDEDGADGSSAEAGSDEPVSTPTPKAKKPAAKPKPKAKDGAKGKAARGGKAAGTGRGGKKAKKEIVKEIVKEEGEDEATEFVEKGTFVVKEEEAEVEEEKPEEQQQEI